ncbi:MAG: hypothetical protein AAGI15_01255 [Pseudomonadota bacterium]
MMWPKLGVVNRSSCCDQALDAALLAANRQIEEDFLPIWGRGVECVRVPRGAPGSCRELRALVLLTDDLVAPAPPASVPCIAVNPAEGDLTLRFTREALELIIRGDDLPRND